MPDIISLGEILIDFISVNKDVSLKESSGFLKAPGGAPANVAVGVAKFGASVGFIGKVGNDPFGSYLKEVLKSYHVDVKNLVFDNYARTTLSFIALKSDGIRDCIFYRNPGADLLLTEKEIDQEYFNNANIFCFGSNSLCAPDNYKATLKAIEYAKQNNMLIAYDPNLRLSLWNDKAFAKQKINEGFQYADIVKISDEEFEFITDTKTPKDCAEYILNIGCKLVVISLGKNGCYYHNGKISGFCKGKSVEAIETTGAGDAFFSALLYQFNQKINSGIKTPLTNLEDIETILHFANTAGGLATTKMGAIPALPTLEEVLKAL